MVQYIEVQGDLLIFKNTSGLAGDINDLISKLRSFSGQLPIIGPRAQAYIKKKTPGSTTVKLGVRTALKGNAFNWKTRRFQTSKSAWIGARALNMTVNYFVNKRLRTMELSAIETLQGKAEGIVAVYIYMFLEEHMSRLPIPGSARTAAANQVSHYLVESIAKQAA